MPSATLTANGNYPSADGYVTKVKNSNSNARIHLSGTFDGATVTVQFKSDAGAWLALDGGAYTAAGDDIINLPDKTTLRLVVTSVGASTSIVYNLV